MQLSASVFPANATNGTITWSITSGAGNANLSGGGLLTATANGSVTVRATANDGSGVYGEKTITITGQADFTGTDKTALNNRINELAAIQKGDYTDASWNSFKAVLASAQDVANNASATQADVDAALSALNSAYNALKQKDFIRLWCKSTKWEKTPLNWFLCIVLFGWIWMSF